MTGEIVDKLTDCVPIKETDLVIVNQYDDFWPSLDYIDYDKRLIIYSLDWYF